MELLPMGRLGPHETSPGVLHFGCFFPWTPPDEGNRLFVRIIHERDQLIQSIPACEFELVHELDPDYGDYWHGEVDVRHTPKPSAQSHWGNDGRYVYRFRLLNASRGKDVDWIIDPFAREYGLGKFSAITVGYTPYDWGGDETETGWKVPRVEGLVVYELMLSEFGAGIKGTISRLDYLADLGINCIEIMPMSNVAETVEWGFLPMGYFGVDERFGKRHDLQHLVYEAHKRGIAVIADAVYGHTGDQFPYSYLYRQLGYADNPFIGAFAKDMFGESTDFAKRFVRDFFYTVNQFWMEKFHIDGFRYDCVPNYWDGPLGVGYANLTYRTYQTLKGHGSSGHWQRFFNGDRINLIQCAEQLEDPRGVLEQSYSNCTWSNWSLDAAGPVAHGVAGSLVGLGLNLTAHTIPDAVDNGDDTLAKRPFHYLENHDHARFLLNFGIIERNKDKEGGALFREGDRSQWFKLQPYLIGLLCAKGIPLLWEGQEIGENWYLPGDGLGRVRFPRPVRWQYFYTAEGKGLISLVRRLLAIRHNGSQFRNGAGYFYNDYENYLSKGLLLFSREDNSSYSLVALNFTAEDQVSPFAFPYAGEYVEALHGSENVTVASSHDSHSLHIPSNYGRIWSVSKH